MHVDLLPILAVNLESSRLFPADILSAYLDKLGNPYQIETRASYYLVPRMMP
jgi:hypothetical protein